MCACMGVCRSVKMCIHVYVSVNRCMFDREYARVGEYVGVRACVYVCRGTCVCVRVCRCIGVYVCILNAESSG